MIPWRNSAPPTHPPLAPVRPRPSAEAPGRDRPDSSLPPTPPVGGKITLQYPTHKEQENSLAGTCLRSVALRSAKSPLPHYHTLDREQGALHRCESPGFVAPSLEAPSLRCSSLGASSLVAPTLRPSSLGDSLPSISLPTENSIPCKTPSTRIAEYCSRVRSRAPLQGARSLITIRSIESMESPSLRCSSLGDSLPSISLPTENSIPCKTVRTKE